MDMMNRFFVTFLCLFVVGGFSFSPVAQAQVEEVFMDDLAEAEDLKPEEAQAEEEKRPSLREGLQSLIKNQKSIFNVDLRPDILESSEDGQSVVSINNGRMFRFKERVWNPARGEHSRWIEAPIKAIAYPFTKIQYDIPNLLTATVNESYRLTPLQNLRGTWSEVKHTFKLLKNAFIEMGSGLLNPRNAAFIDGVLATTDSAFNLARVGTGVIKTIASMIGYPVFKAFGGDYTKNVLGITGSRAAIVLVDTAIPLVNFLLDPYGDQIVRYHLKGVVSYYCAIHSFSGDLNECIDKMPKHIKSVDVLALTHTGGTQDIDMIAERISKMGKTPGLLLTIGCDDPPSRNTEAYNSMGQTGMSWAVHYYLSNALSKRLRGIPMQEAAMQAYYEGIVLPNSVNPISLLGILAVGYTGSRPTFVK